MHNALSVNHFLRNATAADHRAVDAAFGAFSLTDRDDYCRFLSAQLRAVAAVERALAHMPDWRPRADLIADDLAMMGEGVPSPLGFAPPESVGAAWGMLYVLEGSRLGGVVLAQMADAGFPRSFLMAAHAPGEWRAFREAMAHAAERAGDGRAQAQWRQDALSGARAVFALFEEAATEARHGKGAGGG